MKRKTAAFSAALHRNISQFALGRSSALPHFDCIFNVDIFLRKCIYTVYNSEPLSASDSTFPSHQDLRKYMYDLHLLYFRFARFTPYFSVYFIRA